MIEKTELNLLDKAKIISFSPLKFVGTENYPIKIYSSDSTGQGLIVYSNEKRSELSYVNFDNLSNPSQGAWSVSGAVNFYEAKVVIRNCTFYGNRCEDYLNIIRSEFEMSNSVFSNCYSDAFDGDYIKGITGNH